MWFSSGQIDELNKPYQYLLKFHSDDPDFLGNVTFLYCHLNRLPDARNLIKKALIKTPHNAWLQHIYAHTINEEQPNAP